MPAPAIVETRADHEARASILTAFVAPWRRALELAEHLGVSRASVAMWCSGDRVPSWATIRAAGRVTAHRHREAVPALVQALARELLDVDGTWIPDVGADDLASVDAEVGDVMVATGRLLSAVRAGAGPDQLDELGREVVRQAHEAAAAARAVR